MEKGLLHKESFCSSPLGLEKGEKPGGMGVSYATVQWAGLENTARSRACRPAVRKKRAAFLPRADAGGADAPGRFGAALCGGKGTVSGCFPLFIRARGGYNEGVTRAAAEESAAPPEAQGCL